MRERGWEGVNSLIETLPEGGMRESAWKRVQFFIEGILEPELLQVDRQMFEVGGFCEEVRIVPLEFAGWLWLPK